MTAASPSGKFVFLSKDILYDEWGGFGLLLGNPSGGCGVIYDGSFSRRLTKGDGVAVALFKRNGIEVISENDL